MLCSFNIYGCKLGLDPATEEVKGGTQSVAHWLVDDIEESVQNFTKHDAKLISPVSSVGYGIKVATVQDPSGYCIGLIEENAEP